MTGRREGQTVDDDIRILANYCKRLQGVVVRFEREDLEALSEEDLWIVHRWASDTGVLLANLALDARQIVRGRADVEDRPTEAEVEAIVPPPGYRDERIRIDADFEDVLKALLQTPPAKEIPHG